ncbi:MAG: hypothetical protein U1E39_01645 [Planctomycetota bacterium]
MPSASVAPGYFPAFRIAGIDVRFHTLALPLLGLFSYNLEGGDLERAGWRFGGFVLMLLAVLVHELSHGVVARWRGLAVYDVRVHAVGGAARIERPPAVVWTPKDEWVPALAGPLGNLVTALLVGVVAWAVGWGLPSPGMGSQAWARDPVAAFLSANVVLGVLNLVPAFPSDGGRILRAFLAARLPYRTATYVAVAFGSVVVAVAGILLLRAAGPRALVPLAIAVVLLAMYGLAEVRSLRPREMQAAFHRFVATRSGDLPALATLPLDARGLPLPDPAVLGRPDVQPAFLAALGLTPPPPPAAPPPPPATPPAAPGAPDGAS